MQYIKTIKEDLFERIYEKTLIEVLKENLLFILNDNIQSSDGIFIRFKEVDKGRMREEINRTSFSPTKSGFLKYLFTIDKNGNYVDIAEVMIERLQKRIFFAAKELNNNFKDIPVDVYIRERVELEDKIAEEVVERLLKETKEGIINIIRKEKFN